MKLAKSKEKFIPLYSVPLKDDYYFKVRPTANAWWKDQSKVQKLLALLYAGFTAEKACKDIGISNRKYKYFIKIHPSFVVIRNIYKSNLLVKSKKAVRAAVENDPKFALKYWSKRSPDEFPSGYFSTRIANLEQKHEDVVKRFSEELRELKIIIGMYQEVTNELKPLMGGWYIEAAEKADAEVRKYNRMHRRNNERILKHKSATKP